MAKFAAKDSNKNITLSPHGTGKVVVGTGAADATVQSDGNHNLVLQTGNSTTGSISITDGADGDIAISPNGTGTVVVNTDLDVDNININGNAITSTNTDGNIDLTPNGTGEVNISKVDIDAGTIDGATIATSDITVGSSKTLDVSAGTLTTSTAQKETIVQAGPGSGTLDVSGGTLTTSTAQKQAIVSGGGNSEAKGLVPVGAIFQMAFTPGSTWLSTNRFLICDGSSLNSSTDTQYADLYSAIGTTWGGSSASAFNIPDLKGAYLRGVGTSTVFTQNATINLAQTYNDQMQGHRHAFANYEGGTSPFANNQEPISGSGRNPQYSDLSVGGVFDPKTNGTNGTPRTGNETRPNSKGVQFIIKF